MKYAYYPGCSLNSTGVEYGLSTPAVAKAYGIDLWEIPDWNCCGATGAHLTSHWLSLALPARNMAIAEEQGLDVAIPCAACYARSKAAELAVKESNETKKTVAEIIGRNYNGDSKARALLDIFYHDIGIEAIEAKVTKPLKGLKVLSYYGCLLVRPKKTGFDDAEDPQSMDRIMEALGAQVVDWSYKTQCCGAAHSANNPKVGFPMIEKILTAAKKTGADCIVTACPMCVANLDMRQVQVGKQFNRQYDLPIYYFTELMGAAIGIDSKSLGIHKHFVPAFDLIEKTLKGGEA